MTTTTITHASTGITATKTAWRALGFGVALSGDREVLDNGPHGVEALLYFGVQATGAHDESAVVAAIVERDRRQEERTRATAQARLGDAIGALARQLGEESAESLVARMPERLRPYVESVLRGN